MMDAHAKRDTFQLGDPGLWINGHKDLECHLGSREQEFKNKECHIAFLQTCLDEKDRELDSKEYSLDQNQGSIRHLESRLDNQTKKIEGLQAFNVSLKGELASERHNRSVQKSHIDSLHNIIGTLVRVKQELDFIRKEKDELQKFLEKKELL